MTNSIKIGQRHNTSDRKTMGAMAGEIKSHTKAVRAFAGKMSDHLKALGYDDTNQDGAVTMDEAAAQAPAIKLLDFAQRAELVCSAVYEALDDLDSLEPSEAVDALIAARGDATDDPACYVYEDYAIVSLEGGEYQVPYTVEEDDTVVIALPTEWQAGGADEDEESEEEEPADALPVPEGETMIGGAIKMLDDGITVEGCAVRYGSSAEPDMSSMRDYFTKSTDFWLSAWNTRPILYHHALDPDTADAPVIGTWVKAWQDDTGVWLRGQLDKAHKYYAAIKELIDSGALRLSSDSAPHLVRRVPQGNGTHEIARWPMLAASLTPTAAEPRLAPITIKALPNSQQATSSDHERRDGAKVAANQAQRLLLELDLLELEYIPL